MIQRRTSDLELVDVPGGSFVMGSRVEEWERRDDEGPPREVHVKAFRLGRSR